MHAVRPVDNSLGFAPQLPVAARAIDGAMGIGVALGMGSTVLSSTGLQSVYILEGDANATAAAAAGAYQHQREQIARASTILDGASPVACVEHDEGEDEGAFEHEWRLAQAEAINLFARALYRPAFRQWLVCTYTY
jgi:hypothetical protein